MLIEIYRKPEDADWQRCYFLAVGTEGKEIDRVPGMAWRNRILRAEHSPVRTLLWTICMKEIPSYVSVHFTRHKIGVEHYVKSQRNDRQTVYDRCAARQDAPVNHILDINAQALIAMARKRLCFKADPVTQDIMRKIVDAVIAAGPEMEPFLVRQCEYTGRCDEMKPCGLTEVEKGIL